MYDNYLLRAPSFLSASKKAELEEETLKTKQRHKYLQDPEEMAYWAHVFGEHKFEIEPESDEPF